LASGSSSVSVSSKAGEIWLLQFPYLTSLLRMVIILVWCCEEFAHGYAEIIGEE